VQRQVVEQEGNQRTILQLIDQSTTLMIEDERTEKMIMA
jgi:hypothetical protein